MREACHYYEQRDHLPRELAAAFPRPTEPYYSSCLERLDELATWFFSGHSPRTAAYDWDELCAG